MRGFRKRGWGVRHFLDVLASLAFKLSVSQSVSDTFSDLQSIQSLLCNSLHRLHRLHSLNSLNSLYSLYSLNSHSL